jgi:PAS domain S-box-containing protein
MKRAPLPQNESERLAALDRYQILGSEPEPVYDEIAFLATAIADTPIAVISFVSKDKQWFKAKMGIEIGESARDLAFCAHAILGQDLFVVEDASIDPRFSDNPFVTQPNGIRFYAGAPLVDAQGFTLGALAVIDTKPRKLKAKTMKSLQLMARQIVQHLDSRIKAVESSVEHQLISAEKDLYLGLVSSLNDVVFQMSIDGVMSFGSPAWARVTGYSGESFKGQNFFEVVDPTDLPKLKSRVDLLQASKKDERPLRLRILKADGSIAWAELTLVLHEDGETPMLNGVLTDVTEAELANELALKRAEELQSIFEAVPFQTGLIEVNGDDVTLLSANASGRDSLGVKQDQSLPIPLRELAVPEPVLKFWLEKYRESFKLQKPVSFDTMGETSHGERWFSCSVNRCSADSPNRFVFVAEDVTEKWKQEATIADAQVRLVDAGRLSSLAEMAAGLAHEINNPLAIICGLNERMMSDPLVKAEKNGTIRSSLEKVNRAAERISGLVSSLRKLSRDGHADALSEYSVQQVVEDALALCRTRFINFNVNLNVKAPSQPIMAWMRPVPMTQVLVNLLNNAFEAVGEIEEKVIEIEIMQEGDEVLLAVVDSGSGVAKADRAKIFEPFFTTRAPARAGIGLSISRGIVEGHGGQLVLDTTSARTRFSLRIPTKNRSIGSTKFDSGGISV